MHRPGTRKHVYDTFDPVQSPIVTKQAGLIGSDQAWISHCLYPNEATWGRADGIKRTRNMKPGEVPKMVQTPSMFKPWTQSFQRRWPRVARHWLEAMR